MAVSMKIGKQPEVELEPAAAPEVTTAPETSVDQTEADTISAEVDELAQLMAWEAKQKKDARYLRIKELKDKFAARAETQTENDEASPDEKIVFVGQNALYELGPQSHERRLTPEGKVKFAEKVGQEAFFEVATVGIGVIDKYVPEIEQDEYFERSRGSRSGKMLDKKPGNAAKAK